MIPLRDDIPSRTFPFINYTMIAVCSVVFYFHRRLHSWARHYGAPSVDGGNQTASYRSPHGIAASSPRVGAGSTASLSGTARPPRLQSATPIRSPVSRSMEIEWAAP